MCMRVCVFVHVCTYVQVSCVHVVGCKSRFVYKHVRCLHVAE